MKRALCFSFTLTFLLAWNGVVRADDASGEMVTFTRDIAPILQAKCQNCHRPNQMAPMALLSYAEVRPWAKSIKKTVTDRTMPPWHAEKEYGNWSNDISLTDEQFAKIIKWVDQGAPEGNPADMPAAKVWNDAEWKSGQPDIIVKPAQPFIVPPTDKNEDIYQCIVLPTNLPEDTWIGGFEYQIDNPQIVHHVIGFMDGTGKAAALDAETPDVPGYPCGMGGATATGGLDSMIGGWAPGMPPNIYDPGISKLMPKNAHIVFQMHYHNGTGKEMKDSTSVGVYFAREKIRAKGRIMPVAQWKLMIPAGDANAEHQAQWKVPKDIDISTLMPHMHYIGKDMTYTAIYADGTKETLLSVPRFDFNWQTVYHYQKPKHIPAGTMIHVLAHHDNSDANPRNTNHPPIDVTWGESTSEEMVIGWVSYTYSEENLNITPKPPVMGAVQAEKTTESASAK